MITKINSRRTGLAALALCGVMLLGYVGTAIGQSAGQPIPTMVNYQGRLAKADGTVVEDGTYAVTFRLFNKIKKDPTEKKLWEEALSQVVVRNGVFSVLLGSVTPLNANIFGTPVYLEIQIGTDAPLKPRQVIASVPFSLRAENARSSTTVADAAITTAKLADGAVTTTKLADASVVSLKLADGSVVTAKLGDGSVMTVKLADGSVTSAKLADNSVSNGKLSDGAVSAGKLAPDSVTSTKILDGTVQGLDLMSDASSFAKTSGGALSIVNGDMSIPHGHSIGLAPLDRFDAWGASVQNYGLGWYTPADGLPRGGPAGFLSAWGGLRFFTGAHSSYYISPSGNNYVDNRGFGGEPLITFAVGDSDTGLDWQRDGVLSIMANGTQVMNVLPSGVDVGGQLHVYGNLIKSSGSFLIDHPQDPENKYLYHSFVESPDMKNVYDGVIECDENGEATVGLPGYFESLNSDYRYQLTCIGGYAQVYVKKEVEANQFVIAGGKAGLKVSWQVTGIRHDAWANAHRIVPEVDKPESERGKVMHPELRSYYTNLKANR